MVVILFSLSCQFLAPAREGTVIANCADIVNAVSGIQLVDMPQHLIDTGIKRGDEFNVNQYFTILTHISMPLLRTSVMEVLERHWISRDKSKPVL